MHVIVTKNYAQSCEQAAAILRDIVRAKPHAKLGLATGGTPIPVYKHLIEWNAAGEVDFASTRTVNLDEYVGLSGDHPQSYRYFMDSNLFNHINIDKKNTYVPSGLGDPQQAARELDEMVFAGGPPAVQLLGIGANGHLGFNEAGPAVTAESHVEPLAQSTIDANARFFAKPGDVPTHAVTMGMKGILAAEKLLLVATGPAKKDAMHGLLVGNEVTTQNPATFMKLHPDAVVVLDEELANLAGYRA